MGVQNNNEGPVNRRNQQCQLHCNGGCHGESCFFVGVQWNLFKEREPYGFYQFTKHTRGGIDHHYDKPSTPSPPTQSGGGNEKPAFMKDDLCCRWSPSL